MPKDLLDPNQPRAGDAAPPQEADVFVMPCSVSQHRFWLLDQLYPGNSALNIPLAVRFTGPLDIGVLEKALNAIVARHEILRTSFSVVDGEPKQVIKPEVNLQMGVINLGEVPPERREERIEQEMLAEAARPLTLTHPPIFRTVLLRLTPEDNVLLLTLQHIVCDGWSNGIIVREVGVFYNAILDSKAPNLPPLTLQYADFALWQQEWLKTPQFKKQLDFWNETLKGDLPVLNMPTDFPRNLSQDYTAFIESLLLPTSLTDSLKKLCVELDVTLFMILFTTYVALLYRYTGQGDFVIGTTAANRNRSELEHLVGLFANPLILRPEVSGEMTFRELARRMRDHSLNGFAHQEVPFEIILEELQERKRGTRKPTIQTHFLYQKAFMEPATYGDLSIKPLRSVSPGSTFELTYGIVERPEGVRLQMEYHTALYKNSTIKRMLGHFRRLLEAAVENPDTPVSEMALLTDEELAKLKPIAPFGEARPVIDPTAIVQDIQGRLKKHFREAASPHGIVIDSPAGGNFMVLDRHLRFLPVGIPGDLCLSGTFSEILPDSALVSGPADDPAPGPLFRTRFVAVNREDGKIEVLGKVDDFAAINGFQTNLRQVEAVLQRHPGVTEVAAAGFRQPSGENHLVCYVVHKLGSAPTEKDLRAFLKGKISDVTFPSTFVTVSSLPKDAQGEVVSELLPEPAPRVKTQLEKIPLEAILYHQLIEIWTDILKVPSVTVEDNFFALGGSSLLALKMMTQIEKLSGRPLPLSLLLTGATIANIARYIVEANNESASPLVPVQPKGSRQPLFFLHGDWAGGGFYCGRVAQELGEDQPFFALPPWRSGKQSATTLEEMAAYHVAAIREHTPKGPYLIGGYCIGATVAMEMARQLVEKGEKVTHLLLIDPPLWGTPWLRAVWPVINQWGDFRKWDLQKKIYHFDRYAVSFARWLKKPWQNKFATLGRRFGIAMSPPNNPITVGRDVGEGEVEILNSLDYAVYFLAYRLYRRRPSIVPTTLYFPEETPALRLASVRKAAANTSGKVTVETLPGDHHTCITKFTPALVEKIRATLNASQSVA
jgi:pimeloyl-ACP methyl ester carboxylesterase